MNQDAFPRTDFDRSLIIAFVMGLVSLFLVILPTMATYRIGTAVSVGLSRHAAPEAQPDLPMTAPPRQPMEGVPVAIAGTGP